MATGTSPPRSFSRPVLAAVVLLTFVIGGRLVLATVWNPFSRGQAAALRDSGLIVPADHLDFGEVWETNQFNWTLPIQNPLGDDLAFELAASCKCSAIEPRSLMIPAGQTREVKLTIDLTAKASQIPESEQRDFAMSVRPVFDRDRGKVAAAGWTLRGRVRSAIRVERATVDFGRHSELAQPLGSQKVVVTSLVPLQSIAAVSQSGNFGVHVKPLPGETGSLELEISPQTLPAGPINAQIILLPELAGGKRLPGIMVRTTGHILDDVQTSPPEVLFGAVAVGETLEETVTLSSLTSQPFVVDGTACEGEGATVERAPPPDSADPTFVIKQRVVKSGPQTNRVIFRLRTKKRGRRELAISISYLGT